MADLTLRILRRAAVTEGPEAAKRLLRARIRTGQVGESITTFVDLLTSEGALWLAGRGQLRYPGQRALQEHFERRGHDPDVARRLAHTPEIQERIEAGCRARAKREWEPIEAISVLRNRWRIRVAFEIDRMPPGTRAEELRLRAAWLDRLGLTPTDPPEVLRMFPRPAVRSPSVMGWEALLPEVHRYSCFVE